MSGSNAVFLIILVVAAACFSFRAQRLYSFLRIGQNESRADQPLKLLWNVLSIGIAQRKILRDPLPGAMHALVFWGFVVLTVGSAEILASGVFPGFSYERFLPAPI